MDGTRGDQAFIHLASGDEAAEVVEETLRQLDRHETVIAMVDAFTEGPLSDVDSGAELRTEWYKRLQPELPVDELPGDDSDLWEEVRARSEDVVLWHGPHPIERIFALRACWQLRDMPERLYEVALVATGQPWRGGRERPAFYDAVPIAGPTATVPAWSQRTKVIDVSERAERWEKLRSEPGEWIRVLDGETIRHLPVTAFDTRLAESCRLDEWTASRLIVGQVLAAHPIGLSLLVWRVRELLREGKLEGRGEDRGIALPAELRSVSPP
jgi:Domain of unknown function (DUF1835)/Protein of unknown function